MCPQDRSAGPFGVVCVLTRSPGWNSRCAARPAELAGLARRWGDACRQDGGVTDTRRDPRGLKRGSKKSGASIAGECIRERERLSTGWWEVPSGKQQFQTHTRGCRARWLHKDADGILSPRSVTDPPDTLPQRRPHPPEANPPPGSKDELSPGVSSTNTSPEKAMTVTRNKWAKKATRPSKDTCSLWTLQRSQPQPKY